MASRVVIALEVNIRTRVLQSPVNRNGPEGDFSKQVLFNPDIFLIDRLLNTVKLDAFQSYQPGIEKLLPKRVKLSNSGVSLVIALRVSIYNYKAYYPLDFNSSGLVLIEPARGHIGNVYIIVDKKDIYRYAQLGRTRNTLYILYGTNIFDKATSAIFLLNRPKLQASKKAILSSPAGPKTSSTTAPPKVVSQL